MRWREEEENRREVNNTDKRRGISSDMHSIFLNTPKFQDFLSNFENI